MDSTKQAVDKLEIGSGEGPTPGFTHLDVDPDLPGVDIVCNALDVQKFVQEGSVSEIRMIHVLEHFTRREVGVLLDSLYALLKDGGKLYIEVPNLIWHAQLILNDQRDFDAENYAFGGQLDEWDLHKTGFTPTILRKRLMDAGFKNIAIEDQSSLSCEAFK